MDSGTGPGTGILISRISRVMAMAYTPSEKASTRAVSEVMLFWEVPAGRAMAAYLTHAWLMAAN